MGAKVAWIIPLFPLIAFILLILGRKKWSKNAATGMGVLATLASLLLTLPVLWESLQQGPLQGITINWLSIQGVDLNFGIELWPLNVMMLAVVSLVSFLVHIYSRKYMWDDERFTVFYAYLSLFTFSMLGLVISSNLLQMYVFWELVGVCSFLLIGFWYFKPEAREAARKAFIMTRIGDVGFFIGLLILLWQVGSLDLSAMREAVAGGQFTGTMVTLSAILIFLGAIGKSGQFPLHTWLPDAMEGPTPVSALIHAATMVAAGVFLVADLYFLFLASELALLVVQIVGGFTLFFAAVIGLAQNDIKRVLAYSTVSQLGYMMLALGAGSMAAGVFHLMTHAFFKALLFLGAGAVIYSLHHEQNLQKMGGLWKTHRWLGIFFLIGCLAIAGIPPFAGFFSKDEILIAVYQNGSLGWFVVALLGAFITSLYVFRLFFLAFGGEAKGEKEKPVSIGMMIPIAILAGLSLISGFFNLGDGFGQWILGNDFSSEGAPIWIPIVATVVSVLGIVVAYVFYGSRRLSADRVVQAMPWLYQTVERKFYMDELYRLIIVWPVKGIGWILNGFDRFVVGGLVYSTGLLVQAIGRLGSKLQTGQAQTYALVSLFGLILLLVGLTAGRLFQ